jgi:hypothetical protein
LGLRNSGGIVMERVEGKHVTVILDGKKCVHSRNCVLSHPEVFVPNVFVPNTSKASGSSPMPPLWPFGEQALLRRQP